MRRFDISPRRATPKGQPSSSAQHHIERSAYRSTPLRARGTLNIQVIASPDGTILWTSGALPGKAHDLSAARIWGILRVLEQAGIITLADKAWRSCCDYRPLPRIKTAVTVRTSTDQLLEIGCTLNDLADAE
jgi:DDE superfamily endonuclease